jgi:hypothetical protein
MVLAGCNVTPQREALIPNTAINPPESLYTVLDISDDGRLTDASYREGSPSLLTPADAPEEPTDNTAPAPARMMGPTNQPMGPHNDTCYIPHIYPRILILT